MGRKMWKGETLGEALLEAKEVIDMLFREALEEVLADNDDDEHLLGDQVQAPTEE